MKITPIPLMKMNKKVGDSSATMVALSGATVGAATRGTFIRKATSVLSLGILPVFHG
jgi:hypothetical protein